MLGRSSNSLLYQGFKIFRTPVFRRFHSLSSSLSVSSSSRHVSRVHHPSCRCCSCDLRVSARFLHSSSHLKTLGVVGAGQMGTGIAIVGALRAQMDVIIVDMSQKQLDSSVEFTKKLLSKDVSKGKLQESDATQAIKRIKTYTSLSELRNADFVIEAATENIDLKRKIFSDLSSFTRDNVILASNTSSISITKNR